MEFLHITEHMFCPLFDKGDISIVERIEVPAEEEFNLVNDLNDLVFVLQGQLLVSFNDYVNETVNQDSFFFVPAETQYKSKALESTVILLFRLTTNLNFCDHFSFEMLLSEHNKTQSASDFITLKANAPLISYMETMDQLMKAGLRCSYFFELKLKELLFNLRAYYSTESLSALFSSILTDDISFSNKVYEICYKVKSSKELASMMNYSPSGFEKRFKRIFGVSAYQWMKMKKARNIYHEIKCTAKTFSEIGFEYGFSSSSYFNDFCKSNFGQTPGALRKQK